MPSNHSASVSFTSRAKLCRCWTSAVMIVRRRSFGQFAIVASTACVMVYSSMLGNVILARAVALGGRRKSLNFPAAKKKASPATIIFAWWKNRHGPLDTGRALRARRRTGQHLQGSRQAGPVQRRGEPASDGPGGASRRATDGAHDAPAMADRGRARLSPALRDRT